MKEEKKDWLSEGVTWAEAMQKAIDATDASEPCVFGLTGPLTITLLFSLFSHPTLTSFLIQGTDIPHRQTYTIPF